MGKARRGGVLVLRRSAVADTPGVVVCMNSRLVDGELYLIYTGGAALMRAGLSLYKKVRR